MPGNKGSAAAAANSTTKGQPKLSSNSNIMEFLKSLEAKIDSLDKRVSSFEKDIKTLFTQIHDPRNSCFESFKKIDERIERIEFIMGEYQSRIQKIERENGDLRDKLTYLKSQTMRNNLVFGGKKLHEILPNKLEIAQTTVKSMKIERIHRIGEQSDKSFQVPAITLSGVEVTDLKQVLDDSKPKMPPQNNDSGCIKTEPERKTSIREAIDSMHKLPDDYLNALKCCREIGSVDDQDSLEVVLSRQKAIKSLLDAMKKFPKSKELQLEACRSLLKQVQHSEASLHYLSENDGMKQFQVVIKNFPEDTTILAVILDIFGFYSFQDEWRDLLTENVNPSDFLTTMARHENDVIIIEKCCVVVGNLVLSGDIARSLMYVGGVHSIISMMTKYSQNVDILKHCCTALGTFASHDDTCQAVSEAGATCAVMTVMTSFPNNPALQESCCWALASLSRSDCVCMELMCTDAFSVLLKAMTSFPVVECIQEYGCWALCNLVVLASRLGDEDCQKAVGILIDCSSAFTNNVELLEHVCYAVNSLISLKECVHETVVRLDGVTKLIELMRTYEENVDIQLNSCKAIGNIAVNADFRKYAEDMGASEAIIACMLKMEKNLMIQNTCCMTLTNLSADAADNKFRILKNGGVHAVLQSMANNRDDENLQLNALKLLCNLIESDKGCWWIAEESGIQIISMTLKSYCQSQEILAFGCTCLANLPRRGVNAIALESVESTLLYLRMSLSTSVEVARGVCSFYENALKAGKESRKLFNKNAMEKVLHVMQDFDDIDVKISGCKIIAQVAIDEDTDLLTREVAVVLLSTMKKYEENSSIQMICCGTISYLSASGKGLETLQEMCCIDVLLRSMKVHLHNAEIIAVCLLSLENICRADLVRGTTTQHVCDAVALSMKTHPDNKEIQLGGCHILSIIGTGFHKQNELRRQSVEFLEPLASVVHRKSVTDEILQVASAAIHRLRKFTDDVLEDRSDPSVSSEEMPLGIELQSTNLKAPRNSLINDSSSDKTDKTVDED
ncbi:uncharacterized protein LOC123559383 isoform X2 [Mercenaria mercenaria]|uniref:uncharacterized protein LOC123559383 isoform X2 n=1 Tax=Mercenaria mercenaria TaxID=6596 RepID=UPI00234E5DC9|nr:uncharacterized protein LOC123559383 isoform X2 [Mercenaria mercenaria]